LTAGFQAKVSQYQNKTRIVFSDFAGTAPSGRRRPAATGEKQKVERVAENFSAAARRDLGRRLSLKATASNLDLEGRVGQ
jgi:hypothetical protein